MSDAAMFDPDERTPCPDDLCTGILDTDGRCGTCGRAGDGTVVPPTTASLDDAAPAEPSDDGSAPSEPDERVPCPDDMCTGLVGSDGRCGTCGRAADQTSV
jgi:hypothetical protein